MAKRTDAMVSQTAPPLTQMQKQYMLAVLLRDPSAMERASQYLEPSAFSQPEDFLLSVLWASAVRCRRRTEAHPSRDMLWAEAFSDLEMLAADMQRPALEAFFAYAWSIAIDVPGITMALRYLQSFLQHQEADQLSRRLASPAKPVDLFHVLDEHARRVEKVQYGLSRPDAVEAIPEFEDEEEFSPPDPTPLFMFNEFMGGGDRAGDVYGLLGPFKGGKTTALIHLATDRSAQYLREWVAGGQKGPLGLVYYFSYEDPLEDLRLRMLSCRGRLSLTRLREGRPDRVMSRTQYLPYEEKRLSSEIATGVLPFEYDRFRRAKDSLNWNFRLNGMGGQDRKNPGRGGGLVQELVQVVTDDCHDWSRRLNCPVEPRLIIIDFLAAALARHFTIAGDMRRAKDDYTTVAQMFMASVKQMLAGPLRSRVYVAHQFSGEANQKSKSIYPDHTNSAGFKSFSQHTDYTFCFGAVPEGDSRQLFVAKCDAARKSPPRPEMICHLDGDFSRIAEPREKYVFDKMSRQIVTTSDMSRVADPTTMGAANAGGPGNNAAGGMPGMMASFFPGRRMGGF